MNSTLYRLKNIDLYPGLRIIIPSFIILYLPLSYNYQFPNQWGIGGSFLIIIISYLGYMGLKDIYNNKPKWLIFDMIGFFSLYFYMSLILG